MHVVRSLMSKGATESCYLICKTGRNKCQSELRKRMDPQRESCDSTKQWSHPQYHLLFSRWSNFEYKPPTPPCFCQEIVKDTRLQWDEHDWTRTCKRDQKGKSFQVQGQDVWNLAQNLAEHHEAPHATSCQTGCRTAVPKIVTTSLQFPFHQDGRCVGRWRWAGACSVPG